MSDAPDALDITPPAQSPANNPVTPAPAPLGAIQVQEKKPMVQPEGLSIDIYYNPDRLNAMVSYAKQMVNSKAFTEGIANEFQALAILQTGAEMGMAPMEAIGSFYIVKGKIVMYGAAMTRQLKRHGWKIDYKDEEPGKKTTVVITKEGESHEFTAVSTDPVLGRSQAFKNDPSSKLRWHALSRVLRFYAADAMGSVSYISEDFEDEAPVVTQRNEDGSATPARTRSVKKKAFEEPATAATAPIVDADTGEIVDDEMPSNLEL